MPSVGSAIFDMAKGDSHLEELKSKLKSLGPRVGLEQNSDGETILHCAAQHGAKKTVKELAHHFKEDMKSILACQTKKGCGPLHLVAEHGDLPMMEEMLEGLSVSDRPELLRVKDIKGRTPLHWAALNDKTDMVKYMLQSISDDAFMLLSEKDSSGETTLHELAGKGRGNLLDLMLRTVPKERFDLLMNKDNKGRNLLIHAVIGGKSEVVEVLLKDLTEQQIIQLFTAAHSGGQNPFHIAMEKKNLAALKTLLTTLEKFGASVYVGLLQSKDAKGSTCLHTAVKEKSHEALSALLKFLQPEERMKLLSERTPSGNNALHKAVSKKDTKSANIILTSIQPTEKHSLMMQTNRKQQSVLQYAVVKQHREMVEQLLKYCDRAYVRELFFMTDVTGDTPLHASTSREVSQITAHLLDAMSSSHDRYELAAYSDHLYRTALHRAVNAKNVESVKCMLDKLDSAERFKLVKQKHRGGQSALAVAIVLSQPEIIKAIMNYLTAEERKDILLQRDLSHATLLHNACSSGDSGGIASGLLEDLHNKMEKLLRGIRPDSGNAKAEENPNKSTDLMKSLIDTLDVATKVDLLKCKNLQVQNVLHAAASNCSLATLQYLVEGVSAHTLLELLLEKDEDGHTALSAACVKSKKENVQFILHTLRNCDGNQQLILAQDLHGNTTLHLAMKAHRISKLLPGIFVKSHQEDFSVTGDLVKTIVSNISQDVLCELLKVKNVKRKTPLHLAMKTETLNAAKVILEHMPQDILLVLAKQRDLSGKTPFQKALESVEMMHILLDYISACKYDILSDINEDRQSYLHLSAQQKDSDTAMLILDELGSNSEKQLNIMAMKDIHGQTFLHLASFKNPELVRKLVRSEMYKKFIVNLLCIRDDQGRTATDVAEDDELKQQLQELLDESVNHLTVELQQLLDDNPVSSNSPEMLEKLRNLRQPETQQTILHRAIQSGSIDVIKGLKGQLTDHNHWKELLSEKDWLNQSCIHIAVQKGDIQCLNVLVDDELKSSPDLCALLYAPVNVWSENCANIAIRLPNPEILNWMLDGLLNEDLESLLKQKDFREQTVLHAATKLGIKRVNVLLRRVSMLKNKTQKELVESLDSQGCTAADVAADKPPKLREYLLTYTKYYYLPHHPKCLVIYMTREREGAPAEAQTLLYVLEQANLKPKEHENIPKATIMRVIKEAAEENIISGLVVVVMAHGDRAVILDSDNKEVSIQEIIDCMNNPALEGKPKLLVIQACQGNKAPGAGSHSDGSPFDIQETPLTAEIAMETSQFVPMSSTVVGGEASETASGYPSSSQVTYEVSDRDMMVMWSTLIGYVSRRKLFIPTFAKHLGKSTSIEGVEEIYKKTLQDMGDDTRSQIPHFKSSLKYSFALKRIWNEI